MIGEEKLFLRVAEQRETVEADLSTADGVDTLY